ncbi:MAG: hypothetical protein ABIH26_06915 [Candidatus Eisenbacteria bacterium]
MPEVVNGNNILLGRGKIYFDRFDAAGARTGELFLGNCPTFEITPTSEDIKKYSSADKAADLIASDVLRTTLALRIVGDEFSKENLAMALFGDTATLSQTGSSVTDEAISGVLQGRYYPLSKRQVSAVTVTGPGGTPTYVVDDDYKVDAVSGRIYIVEGGGIADDADIEVDFTYGTIALPTIRGMNQTSVKGYLRFIGDPARGPKYECEIWRASVRADGAIGFISDEYSSFSLTGDIESDAVNNPDEPHYRLIRIA